MIVAPATSMTIWMTRFIDRATTLPLALGKVGRSASTDIVRGAPSARSAAEVADATGTSRVTARRYLEHLAAQGLVVRGARHGHSGRPEVEYVWQPADVPTEGRRGQ